MGNVANIQGRIVAGPQKSGCSSCPSALINATLELTPPNKVAEVACVHTRQLQTLSPAFATLSGIGDTVTRATLLYVRTTAKVLLRLTQNGDSGDQVSLVYVQGLFIQEFPAGNYLKLLEAQGVGVVEYFASGNQ